MFWYSHSIDFKDSLWNYSRSLDRSVVGVYFYRRTD